jgi:hypothetical protein
MPLLDWRARYELNFVFFSWKCWDVVIGILIASAGFLAAG